MELYFHSPYMPSGHFNTIKPTTTTTSKPVPVAARSKAYVCGRSLAEIVGSIPTGGMDVCLLRVLCVVM